MRKFSFLPLLFCFLASLSWGQAPTQYTRQPLAPATAAAASTVTITNDATTNATMFPTWVTANTGNLPLYVSSSKVTWNPSTGTFTAPTITASTLLNPPQGAAATPALKFGASGFGVFGDSGAGILWGGFGSTYGILDNTGISISSSSAFKFSSTGVGNGTPDLYVTRPAAKLLMISGDGTGTSSGNVGITIGNDSANPTYYGIWPSTQATRTGPNAALTGIINNTYLQGAGSAGTVYIVPDGATIKETWLSTAGAGPAITAGTAASAVSAWSVTQTHNYNTAPINTAVINATLTSTHANSTLQLWQQAGVTQAAIGQFGRFYLGGGPADSGNYEFARNTGSNFYINAAAGPYTLVVGGSAGEGIQIVAGTALTAKTAEAITQTWNYNTTAIDGVLWTFTNTSSHANTNALNIKVGANTILGISKAGYLWSTGGMVLGGQNPVTGAIALSAGSVSFYDSGFTGISATITSSALGATLWKSGSTSVFGFTGSSDGSAALTSGISALGAASLAIGNGTAGDFTGTLKLSSINTTGTGSAGNSVIDNANTFNLRINTTDRYRIYTSAGAHTHEFTSGTSTSAGQPLIDIFRTNNNAAVNVGIRATFTDTLSAAGFLPLQILCGASGTTNCLSVDKNGGVNAASFTSTGTMTTATTLNFSAVGTGLASPVDGQLRLINSGLSKAVYLSVAGATSHLQVLDSAGTGNGMLSLGATTLTLTAGAFGMPKMTASASAPGATGAKLEMVCGTNAGSLKLVAYAGTSGTAVDIKDNIGSGVTGC